MENISGYVNNIGKYISSSGLIVGIFKNLFVATVVVVLIVMVVNHFTDTYLQTFLVSITFVGIFMVIHHSAYKKYYTDLMGISEGDEFEDLISSDLVVNSKHKCTDGKTIYGHSDTENKVKLPFVLGGGSADIRDDSGTGVSTNSEKPASVSKEKTATATATAAATATVNVDKD